MCLYTKQTKPKIASRPITVWKGLRNQVDPNEGVYYTAEYYRDYIYKPGVTYEQERPLVVSDHEVDIAFHSMKYRETVRRWIDGMPSYALAKFIIPAGALYFEGTYCGSKGYASNKITFVSEVTQKRESIYNLLDKLWLPITKWLGI